MSLIEFDNKKYFLRTINNIATPIKNKDEGNIIKRFFIGKSAKKKVLIDREKEDKQYRA